MAHGASFERFFSCGCFVAGVGRQTLQVRVCAAHLHEASVFLTRCKSLRDAVMELPLDTLNVLRDPTDGENAR
jgi:hypothetical protein